MGTSRKKPIGTVAELFAGVGGFRCGLEPSGWQVVWSNQWEPASKVQHASDCYLRHWPDSAPHHSNEDIEHVVTAPGAEKAIPEFDLLVGGFPCQDYSVAKPLPQATGLRGKKGVLWWSIYRLLEMKKPRFVLLENVDRLLKSPSTQRGRDFGVILSCFARLGYAVEWRVINAAEYGFPQRRRRVFIFAELDASSEWTPRARVDECGVFARAFPVIADDSPEQLEIRDDRGGLVPVEISPDPYIVSERFGNRIASQFSNAGVMIDGVAWTRAVTPAYDGPYSKLADVVNATEEDDVPPTFYLPRGQKKFWEYLKGAKREPRTDRKTGFKYLYTEGAVAFPEPLEKASRTILTGEGGTSPSRSKHVIRCPIKRKLRRLTPEELEALNGFPRGWTEGMPDARRAFMMGNALVVGVVEKIGEEIAREIGRSKRRRKKVA